MLTLVGFGTAKLRRPIRLPSWVGFAVAVELPAGLLRLFLIGQPSHSRTRIYPLAAARRVPSGAGHLSPGGYGTWAPSLNSVLRGADTLLPCSPRPSSSFLLHYLTSVSGKRRYRALSLNPRRARPPVTTRAIQLTDFGTDQSPMMTVHSAKIRTKWKSATTPKIIPATRENVFASMIIPSSCSG